MTTLDSSVERIDGPFIPSKHNRSAQYHHPHMTNSGSTFSLIFSDEPKPKKKGMSK